MGRDKGIRNWKYWCSRVGSRLAMWKDMAEKQYSDVGGQDRNMRGKGWGKNWQRWEDMVQMGLLG